MTNPEKQPNVNEIANSVNIEPKDVNGIRISKQLFKSAETLLAEYTGNDEQYKAYLRGEYPDPRD